MTDDIDFKRQRFPYCIVWSPLPLITALLPCIGHTGICTSEGVIHDFAGSYSVSVDDMAFGNPTKYVPLGPVSPAWDEHVEAGDKRFRKEVHDLCRNNCHSHVAYVLNQSRYKGGGWNMVSVWWLCLTQGRHIGLRGFVQTYLSFALLFLFVYVLRCLI